MAVLIGHASIDENGKAKGGLAGDQTGKEVCTRNWYNKDWNIVLRPKTDALAENSARICETICENSCVGYDQNQRNTLWKAYLNSGKISPITNVECDCSSFMTYCAILGGANIAYGTNAPTTSTMRAVFGGCGNYDILTDKKYTDSSDYLKRGDILVREGSHTVMVLTDGAKVKENTVTAKVTIPSGTLKKGNSGTKVTQLQKALNTLFLCGLVVDGSFGTKTYNAVVNSQRTLKNAGYYTSTIDGIYGTNNRKAMVEYAKVKGYKVN